MDCLQTVSKLYMYICVSLPVNKPYHTLVSLRQYVLSGYDNVTFFLGGGCLICLMVLVVKLLTGFEAFGPPVKKISHLESVLSFWMEPPLCRYLKVYGLALFSVQYTKYVFKMLRNIHILCSWLSGFSVRHMLGGQFRSKTREKWGNDNHRRVGPSGNCRTKKWQGFLWEDDNKLFHYLSNCCVSGHKICQLRNNNHRLRLMLHDESATILLRESCTLREKKLGLSVSSLQYAFICGLFAWGGRCKNICLCYGSS